MMPRLPLVLLAALAAVRLPASPTFGDHWSEGVAGLRADASAKKIENVRVSNVPVERSLSRQGPHGLGVRVEEGTCGHGWLR